MGKAQVNLRGFDLARQNTVKAYELRDRASEREKMDILAAYDAYVTGDLHKTIADSELWVRTYPRDRDPHFQLISPTAPWGNGKRRWPKPVRFSDWNRSQVLDT